MTEATLQRINLDELDPFVARGIREGDPTASWLVVEAVEGSRSGVAVGKEHFGRFEHNGISARIAHAVFMNEGELYIRSILHEPVFKCNWYIVRGFIGDK